MKLNDRKESSMKYIPKTEHIIQLFRISEQFRVLIVSNSVQLETRLERETRTREDKLPHSYECGEPQPDSAEAYGGTEILCLCR